MKLRLVQSDLFQTKLVRARFKLSLTHKSFMRHKSNKNADRKINSRFKFLTVTMGQNIYVYRSFWKIFDH